MQEIKVIGSGVAGLCVAKELVSRGSNVIVIDKTDAPSSESCSWWAGGMLAPWCEGESTEDIIVKLGQESISWWSKNVEGVVKKGSLVIALSRDEPDLKRFGRRTDNYINLDSREIGELEPDLKGRFNKGLYFKKEAHLSPRSSLSSLKKNKTNHPSFFFLLPSSSGPTASNHRFQRRIGHVQKIRHDRVGHWGTGFTAQTLAPLLRKCGRKLGSRH